ncbi:MAG: hypothetical protein LUD41_02420 [Phascolarctobacterium sp.]|nr:hypothetical protein [Phascolarctobacterium sp.]
MPTPAAAGTAGTAVKAITAEGTVAGIMDTGIAGKAITRDATAAATGSKTEIPRPRGGGIVFFGGI